MRYTKFFIENYRGITDEVRIDVEKNQFLPIVGLNESGKTTILEALFAFDHTNDPKNDGRHLRNTKNLWTHGDAPSAVISAEIALDASELKHIIGNSGMQFGDDELSELSDLSTFQGTLIVHRDLDAGYSSSPHLLTDWKRSQQLLQHLVNRMPAIHLFDDTYAPFPETVEILGGPGNYGSIYLEMLDRLFKVSRISWTVFDLPRLTDNQREDVFDRVNRTLNAELASTWTTLRFAGFEDTNVRLRFAERRLGSDHGQ